MLECLVISAGPPCPQPRGPLLAPRGVGGATKISNLVNYGFAVVFGYTGTLGVAGTILLRRPMGRSQLALLRTRCTYYDARFPTRLA
jgi:hypothetical protein